MEARRPIDEESSSDPGIESDGGDELAGDCWWAWGPWGLQIRASSRLGYVQTIFREVTGSQGETWKHILF